MVMGNMEFQGYIFQNNEDKTRIIIEEKNFWIGIISLLFCIVVLDFNQEYWNLDWLSIVFKFLAFFSLIFTFWNRFSGMNKKEPLKGTLNWVLKINLERIEINKKTYFINDISNLKIQIKNFSGKFQFYSHYPGPWRSNGVGNTISFIGDDGIKIEEKFSIQSEKDYEILKKLRDKLITSVELKRWSKFILY